MGVIGSGLRMDVVSGWLGADVILIVAPGAGPLPALGAAGEIGGEEDKDAARRPPT